MKIFSKLLSSDEFYDKIHKAQIQDAMEYERLNSGCEMVYEYCRTIFPFSRYCMIHAVNWFGMVESMRFDL